MIQKAFGGLALPLVVGSGGLQRRLHLRLRQRRLLSRLRPPQHAHVVAFSVCNTIGQIFIFQTIRSFGAVVFAIVMNTRIILSILASCAIYSHSVSSQGFFGLFIVFASVGYRIQRKTAGQKIVRWRATTEVGEEWFHEVHEHIDGM